MSETSQKASSGTGSQTDLSSVRLRVEFEGVWRRINGVRGLQNGTYQGRMSDTASSRVGMRRLGDVSGRCTER